MAYNYTTFVAALANEMPSSTTAPEFVAVLPTIIDYAEQRIYRELDLLSTVVTDNSGTLTPNARAFTLPQGQGRFVTITGMSAFTPVGTMTRRNPLAIVSRGYIDFAWPTDTAVGVSVPSVYAMHTDQDVVVGPPPDAAYAMEVIGTIRPAPLAADNPNTFLTDYLPDLFFAAAMVRASAYMRNFGAQADDPKQAMSWETTYQTEFGSADAEEMRKRWQGTTWSAPAAGPRS